MARLLHFECAQHAVTWHVKQDDKLGLGLKVFFKASLLSSLVAAKSPLLCEVGFVLQIFSS
jgi:hypothetical protein